MKQKQKAHSKIKNKSFFLGLAAIVLALIVAVALYMATTVKANDTVQVVSAKTDIAQGKQLTDADLELVTVSRYNLPGSVLENKEAVIGKYANLPMKAGDYVFSSKISQSALGTDTQLADLADGKLAISFTVKSQAAGVANKLQAGDVIRVYSYDQAGGVQDYKELSYVQVLSASDSTGAEVNSGATETQDTTYSALTISATPEQAKKLILLENTNNIYVTFLTRNAETAAVLLDKQAGMLG